MASHIYLSIRFIKLECILSYFDYTQLVQLGLTHNIIWDLVIEYQFGNIDITANVSGA